MNSYMMELEKFYANVTSPNCPVMKIKKKLKMVDGDMKMVMEMKMKMKLKMKMKMKMNVSYVDGYLVIKVFKSRKLSSEENFLLMKVIY